MQTAKPATYSSLAAHLAFVLDEHVKDVVSEYGKRRSLPADFQAALDRDVNAHREAVIEAVCKFGDSQVAALIAHEALHRADPTNTRN